jgi:hypothetical protein
MNLRSTPATGTRYISRPQFLAYLRDAHIAAANGGANPQQAEVVALRRRHQWPFVILTGLPLSPVGIGLLMIVVGLLMLPFVQPHRRREHRAALAALEAAGVPALRPWRLDPR